MVPTSDPDRGSALLPVRGVIERLVRGGSAVARSDSTLHSIFPVAVYAAEGDALREWVLREEATKTIEIGLGYGISALHVCEGLLVNADPTARRVALDPYQATRFADCGLQVLEEAGVDGGTPRGGVADRASAISRERPAFSPGVRGRQPPLRRGLRRPRLPRTAGTRGRDSVRRRLPAACGRARGVVLYNEPGLDARGSFGRGRTPPMGRSPHFRGSGHATV